MEQRDQPGAVVSSEGLGAGAGARSYPACKGRNCGCTDGVSHSPECQQEHEDAIAGVLGRCSVPMWMHGCPAGHCDRKAYGVRPPSRMFWSYPQGRMVREDGRYDGYVPGLACPGHGGPEAPSVGGEARLAAHQPSHTTTATPQGVASTDQLGRAS